VVSGQGRTDKESEKIEAALREQRRRIKVSTPQVMKPQ
jgi:hypothetical protein